jgi:hypothetical protein
LKIGVVGPPTWFAGHYPEHWQRSRDIMVLDTDEGDYRFLVHLMNFRPDITLFFRPELYSSRYLEQISGIRVAFLSEPVPYMADGQFVRTAESNLRLRVYERMSWSSYHLRYYYDSSKRSTIDALGWPIDNYRPMPIDTSCFFPEPLDNRPIDVFFIGKATAHRIEQLDFLRSMQLRFQWIAHGVFGAELANVLRRCKVVLNIHADRLPALEPRVHLAAACGCMVLSESIDGDVSPFRAQVRQYVGSLTRQLVLEALDRFRLAEEEWRLDPAYRELSCRAFLDSVYRCHAQAHDG